MIVLLLHLLIAPAHADCMQWGHDLHGDRVCMREDLVNRNPVIPDSDNGGSMDLDDMPAVQRAETRTGSGTITCVDAGCGMLPGMLPVTTPDATYGCLPGEETVMRYNFKIGCAKGVHEMQWH